jgi:hypothetical protein
MKRQKRDWNSIIRAHEESGKSVREFCEAKRIPRNTFYKNRKLHQIRSLVEISGPSCLEITPIILKTRSYSLAIRSGFDPGSLKSILQVIEKVE